jgi:hypothetical protein
MTFFHKLRHRELEELEGDLEETARHRPISLEDPDRGRLKMGTDIPTCLFRNLAGRGHTRSNEVFICIKSCCLRIAQDFIARCEYDSGIDREKVVHESIHSCGLSILPSWKKVDFKVNWRSGHPF